MAVGFEDACNIWRETWTDRTDDAEQVEVWRPDNGRNRPRTVTAEFDILREAWGLMSSFIRLGTTAITAQLVSDAPPVAKSRGELRAPATRAPATVTASATKRDPVEISRHWRHLAFLKQVSTGDDPAISPHIASLSMRVWSDIRRATHNRMPVPAAVSGPDGQMFYSWDCGRHHMELEIVPNEPAFFFYRDRQTGETWSEEYEIGDRLTADVTTRLELFF